MLVENGEGGQGKILGPPRRFRFPGFPGRFPRINAGPGGRRLRHSGE